MIFAKSLRIVMRGAGSAQRYGIKEIDVST